MRWAHFLMAVDLYHLAHNFTDEEFAKTIISSGDYFPGFYRFTMGNRKEEDGQLTIKGLTSAFFEQTFNNKHFTRSEWTNYSRKRHEALDSRNLSRSDGAVYDLLDVKYLEWMTLAKEYDIAVIEIESETNTIELNTTYFFMGSLIRFSDTSLKVGYDFLRNKSLIDIPVNIHELIDYTHEIYGDNLKDFFLLSDIVASLTFYEDNGILKMTEETIDRAIISEENSVLISSNSDVSSHLPIRWAKDILLSEVI